MKNLNLRISDITRLMVVMMVVSMGCRKTNPEPLIYDDSKPRIKSVSLEGVPPENIEIDQDKLYIKVKVPSLLEADLDLKIELTDNARIRGGLEQLRNETYTGVGLFLEDSIPISLVYKDDPLEYPTPVSMYRFILSPSGTLTLRELKQPLNHELFTPQGSSIFIPFLNMYGNSLPSSVKLINQTSGKVYNVDHALFKGYGVNVNNLGIDMNRVSDLVPGKYSIEIISKNGDNFRVKQPLIIKAGPINIRYTRIYFGYDVFAGKTLNLEGYNLFKGYLSLSLIDKTGRVFPLDQLDFKETGLSVEVHLPENLELGQYVLRAFQNGSQTDLCYRVNVIDDAKKRTYIGTIGSHFAPCSLNEATVVPRDDKIFLTYFSDYSGIPRLKMVLQDNSAAVDYGVVTAYENPTSPFPPSVTFTKVMTPGYYSATLEILDVRSKVVAESAPYSRLIKIE